MEKTILLDNYFKSCTFTGYRPSKFPFELNKKNIQYIEFENRLSDAVLTLFDRGFYTFYTGAAMGFDIIAAETVLQLRKAYNKASIKLVCAIPFKGQSDAFSDNWKGRYDNVVSAADETILLSDSYFKGCYQRRNEFMVNNSELVLTWFDGHAGGTGNTLYYAQKNNKEIINLYNGAIIDYSSYYDFILVDEEN